MKKEYMKPQLEIEIYQLNAAIAANCTNVITLGPEAPGKVTCDEFKTGYGDETTPWGLLREAVTPFYNDGSLAKCDCYYSSGGNGYFTS